MTSILKVNEIDTYDNTASITIKHDGTSALVIDTSGNIGIGTTSPTVRLDIAGSSNTTSRARITKTGSGTLQLSAHSDGIPHPYIGSESNHNFSLISNGNERMRIDSSGNVGIGTTSPAELLHVAGDTRVGGNLFRNGQYRYADYSKNHTSSTGTLVANMNTVYGNTYYLEITILGTENTLNRGMAKYLMIGTYHGANSNYYVTLSEIGRAGMNNQYGRPYLYLNGYESSFTTTDQTASGTNVDRNELYCRTNAAYSGNMRIMIDRYQPAA